MTDNPIIAMTPTLRDLIAQLDHADVDVSLDALQEFARRLRPATMLRVIEALESCYDDGGTAYVGYNDGMSFDEDKVKKALNALNSTPQNES